MDESNSGNYSGHLTCYACGDTHSSMDYIEVRKRPYTVSSNRNGILGLGTASLYFKKSKVWLETFYFGERAFTDLRSDNWRHILRVPHAIDLTKYTPETLEDKIKTWILFS